MRAVAIRTTLTEVVVNDHFQIAPANRPKIGQEMFVSRLMLDAAVDPKALWMGQWTEAGERLWRSMEEVWK
jgi:hypothetical protein